MELPSLKHSDRGIRGIKRALIAVCITGLGSFALSGCVAEDGSTGNQTVKFDRIAQPTGQITGVVVDTNGNPVRGAVVSAAGQRTRTDAQGVYSLKGVNATNTVNTTNANNDGADGAGEDTDLPAIPVSIRPRNRRNEPALLGAVVSVTPVAQMSSHTGGDGADACDANATCSGGESILTVFIDNFTASAGTAVLPSLEASVRGVLRDNQTGEPIPDTRISLDMRGLTEPFDGSDADDPETEQQPETGGELEYSYQTFNYTARTNEDGEFVFENLPTDSDLRVDVEGWDNPDIERLNGDRFDADSNDHIRTYDESIVRNLGNVFVDRVLSDDDVEPYFTNVLGVVTPGQPRGQLNRDTDGTAGLVFPLSERILADRVNAATVKAYDTDQQLYLGIDDVSVSSDEKSIVVTLTNPLEAGNDVNFFFHKSDVVDRSENVLTDDNGDIDYDFDPGNGYVRVDLEAFQEATMPSGIAAASQLDDDPAGQEEYPLLDSTSNAFANSFNAVADVQQLNSANDDDGDTVPDAQARLEALSNELLTEAAGQVGPTFNVGAARLSFEPTDVEEYTIEVLDEQGIARNAVALLSADPLSSNMDLAGSYSPMANRVTVPLMDSHTGDAFFMLDGVEPGWTVRIYETDSLGNNGQPIEVALADTVAPTTVLQNSYGFNAEGTTGEIAVTYGDGGELAQSEESQLGMPRLHVTPYLFAAQDGTVATTDQGAALDPLFEGKQTKPVDGLPLDDGQASYDATAFTGWPAQARTVGVAFSENVAVTGTPTYNGAVTVNGFEANNDVTVNDQGAPVNVDLVNVNVADILGFSLDDGSVLNFADAIQDEAGNAASADTNARVAVTDRIPPFVTSATYAASGELTLNFNEPVSIAANDDVTGLGGLCAAKPDDVDGVSSVTFGRDEVDNCFGVRPSFAALTVDTLDDGDPATDDPRFTRINFNLVEDGNGNSWPFDGTLAPEFLVELPGPFARAAAPATTNFAATNTTFTVEYSFDHALDLTLAPVFAAEPDELTAAEVAATFVFTDANAGGVAIDATSANTSATLSADGQTLTVSVELTGGSLETGDTFGAPAFLSGIDSSAAAVNPDEDPAGAPGNTDDLPTVP